MTNISNSLADEQFISWCKELETEMYKCLGVAWDDERISKTRKERIKDKFADAMMKRSEENGK